MSNGSVTTEDQAAPSGPPPRPAPRRPPRAEAPAGAVPRLADGVTLIGAYEGSGYKEPPSLVRRVDGQIIQLPDILYRLVETLDDASTTDWTVAAERLSQAVHRSVGPDDIRFLVDEKLRPLGLVTLPNGSSPEVEKPDPFLAFRHRMGVVSEQTSQRLGDAFRWLFLPPIVLAVLAGFVGVDVWLFFSHGVAQPIRQSIEHPGLFLPILLAVVVSAAFHEIGHAAACRYGGGNPGRMGCGLYLAWPAFYTDVTDAYRLSRRARLRTDLGGIYFNVVIVLATVGAYFATHLEVLLLLVLIEHVEIIHQLLPVVRLDGYYIVADLTGVPDLFARIGPILASLVPGRASDDRVKALKPWVRVAVTAWVVVIIPLLGFEFLVVLLHLPRILGTAWSAAARFGHETSHALGRGDVLAGVADVLQILVLAIPIVGILLMVWRFGQQGSGWAWRVSDGRPALRAVFVVAGTGAAVLLAMAWIPKSHYTPIRPGEKGTVAAGNRTVGRHILHPTAVGTARPTTPRPATVAPTTTVRGATTSTTSSGASTTSTSIRTSTTLRPSATTATTTDAPVATGVPPTAPDPTATTAP